MQDDIRQAISWLLLGVAGGLGLDLCAKQLLQAYSLREFVLLRSLFALVIFLLLAPRLFGGLRQLRTRRWRWHALRTALAAGAMFGFFYGLAHMPLVDALTLGFTAPLMVTALSAMFLGEHVGWHRWMAVIVGFVGTLVMLRPGSGEISAASVAVLIAAFCYATQAITARHLSDTESTLSLSVYVILGPMLIAIAFLDQSSWITPDRAGWLLMALAGACSAIAWVGFINGYRRASPALLAPLEYTALIGGAVAGFLIWDEIPDRWTVIGASIIIASGLYVVYREATLKKVAQKKGAQVARPSL
ncbi:MAG: DMT family transporter [Gammaproteobacteria bacterium]|nr:DMT family transporter [Gammaproteobacteria bacterium]